jgi:hypothetical protein
MLSVACEQEVSRDRDPKCVTADKGYLDEDRDNRQPGENQGDQEYVIKHGSSPSQALQTIAAIR